MNRVFVSWQIFNQIPKTGVAWVHLTKSLLRRILWSVGFFSEVLFINEKWLCFHKIYWKTKGFCHLQNISLLSSWGALEIRAKWTLKRSSGWHCQENVFNFLLELVSPGVSFVLHLSFCLWNLQLWCFSSVENGKNAITRQKSKAKPLKESTKLLLSCSLGSLLRSSIHLKHFLASEALD